MRLYFFIATFITLLGAKGNVVDSLEKVLASTEIPDKRLSLISAMLENTIYSDLEAAQAYVNRFRSEAEEYGLEEEIARSFNFEGMVAYMKGDINASISAYLEAIAIYQKLDDQFMIGMLNNNIGSLYELKNPEKAVEYFLIAKEYFSQIDSVSWQTRVTYNIGNQQLSLSRYGEAVISYQEAYAQFVAIGQQEYLPHCLSGIGKSKWKLGQPDSAVVFYQNALRLLGNSGEKDVMTFTHSSLCGIFSDLGIKDSAYVHCKLAQAFADESGGVKTSIAAKKFWYVFYKKFGPANKALTALEQYKVLNDSLSQKESDEYLAETLTKYESVKKEEKIRIQELELEQGAQEKRFLWVLIALIGTMLLGGVFFIYNKTKTNNKLKSQKKLIETALGEKDLLLREIHHRVKNNLQIISSLLSIQSKGIKDDVALEAVNESRNRVKSMALIHQNLYQEDDLTGIDMKDYIGKLGVSLIKNYNVDSNKIDFVTDIHELSLDVDTTIPLGLILNELIANALKYAFPNERSGELQIQLREENEELFLQVRDNGVGIEATKTEHKEGSTGFGMKMIQTFSKKLKAEYKVYTDNGTVVELRIKNYKLVG